MFATTQFASMSLARRPSTPEPRCCFVARNGFKCPNYSKHKYDGQELCNVHLGYVKAREPCSICLEPMSCSSERCKLGCGHYFHTECLSKCHDPECPLCRQQIAPKQACKIFYSSKIEPLMTRLYSLEPKQIAQVLGCMEKVVSVAERPGRESWEVDYLDGLLDSYRQGLIVCDNACEVIDAVPEDVMGDACCMFTSSLIHMSEHRSFTGFETVGAYDGLSITSVAPMQYQQMWSEDAHEYVPAAPAPSPDADEVLMFGEAPFEGHGGQLM